LVTGAAGGIGTAFATRLAERGMDLALFDFDGERLAHLAERLSGGRGRILTRTVDVSDSDALAEALDDVERAFAGVSLCAPFAALFGSGRLEEPRARALMRAVNVGHVETCAEWTQNTAARTGSDSHVLMTSSRAAVERSPTRYYAATKAELLGVASLVRARGRRLGRHTGTQHRVTAAVLYPTRTRFGSSSARVWREHEGPEFPDASSLPELDDWLVEHGGSPEHVARVLLEAVRRRKRLVFVAPSRRIAMRDSIAVRITNPVLRHPVARRIRRSGALRPRLQ